MMHSLEISWDRFYSIKKALNLGIIGTSQLELQALTNTTTAQISMIYTVRSIMAILASLVMGPILDKTDRYITVAISLLLTSLFTTAGPWSRSWTAVLITLGVPEFFGCALGMGTHLLTVDTWKKKSGPFLQLLNFISISGFTVAPQLVKPFLKEVHSDENDEIVCGQEAIITANRNATNVSHSTIDAKKLTTNRPELHEEYQIYLAYLIVGIYGVVVFFLFVVIIIKDRQKKNCKQATRNDEFIEKSCENEEDEKVDEKEPQYKHTQIEHYFIYFVFFWMILFYGGIEVSFPGQITPFVHKHFCWQKGNGAQLASLVMGSNGLFTLLGIFLSTKIRPAILIGIDVIGLLISLFLLAVLVEIYPNTIWLCAVLVGAASATIMPSAYTWANESFGITWLFNSAFWCGFFAGFMISNLTGFLMDTFGMLWYCYTMLICAFLVVLLFCILVMLVNKIRCQGKKRNSN